MKIPHLFLAIFAFLCGHASAQDLVIYGSTPGGIAAAISAARMGREVTLVEYHDHLGGMTTSVFSTDAAGATNPLGVTVGAGGNVIVVGSTAACRM